MNLQSEKAGEALAGLESLIAKETTALEFASRPDLFTRFGALGVEKSLQDAAYHLSHLTAAIEVENVELFIDYIAWAKVVLIKRGMSTEDLVLHLGFMKQAFFKYRAESFVSVAVDFLDEALRRLPEMPEDVPSFMDERLPLAPLAADYLAALLRGNRRAASEMVLKASNEGVSVEDLDIHVFQLTQREVGRLWQTNRINVANEHYCTAATQLIMSLFYPRIFSSQKNKFTLVATTITGDPHEIGVRMVADFFELRGWNTHYLGANVPNVDVISTLRERKPDILALSTNLLCNLKRVKHLIKKIRMTPELSAQKIMVGGAPFNLDPTLCKKVGADAFAPDARSAVDEAAQLILESNSA